MNRRIRLLEEEKKKEKEKKSYLRLHATRNYPLKSTALLCLFFLRREPHVAMKKIKTIDLCRSSLSFKRAPINFTPFHFTKVHNNTNRIILFEAKNEKLQPYSIIKLPRYLRSKASHYDIIETNPLENDCIFMLIHTSLPFSFRSSSNSN